MGFLGKESSQERSWGLKPPPVCSLLHPISGKQPIDAVSKPEVSPAFNVNRRVVNLVCLRNIRVLAVGSLSFYPQRFLMRATYMQRTVKSAKKFTEPPNSGFLRSTCLRFPVVLLRNSKKPERRIDNAWAQ